MVSPGISVTKNRTSLPVCAVLLAGGRGTRFWPRSRMRAPKQLLNITGKQSMLRQTVSRLEPLISLRNFWVVTNVEQSAAVRRQLQGVPAAHILAEPIGRNTAAAIGLAAIHLIYAHGDALMAVLPSDSHVADGARYRSLARAAVDLARTPGNLVVFGIPPTRPETGYGYIEAGHRGARTRVAAAYPVRHFTEKPAFHVARRYLASGNYYWNAGLFFWRASTYLENLGRFLPATHSALSELAKTIGTRRYGSTLRRIYSGLENISVDYAIMEPAAHDRRNPSVYVIPAKVGWSDIGSWQAVFDLLAAKPGANVSASPLFALDSTGNYFWSPKKFIAAIGVNDLVLVETEDAILICPRDRSQDVGKIVKWLEQRKLHKLI
ncbi:MAG: sugar phosphate nucleotidyltransferase [Candidatus Acidiferrales bacterium]